MELEYMASINRVVEESKLEKLKYLDMFIKETLRIHPVSPLLGHNKCMENYETLEFGLSRRNSGQKDLREDRLMLEGETSDFQLIPFGFGRRGCPGLQLARTVVWLVLAQLVHCFDWKLKTTSCQVN
ncbi:hypothetical protein Ahy_B03g063474 [Arachis hypogaea]|uniref:Cytochrome P450 n=1 Tax=Arachis hypogaea TaxID=3818 RepID=A0A444ZXT4_ARAHY|nr:hypothetical protein Ahy_B03g063474 [Arachis hypogaea]